MQTELVHARGNLRQKLMNNADAVIKKVLEDDLSDIVEVGIFERNEKNSFTCNSDSDIYLLFEKKSS